MPVCIALLRCRGHPNVQAHHRSTLELEEESRLTVRGDCVVCVSCQGSDVARECSSMKGLGKLVIAALRPYPPGVEAAGVDGYTPGQRPGRLIARRGCHLSNSILVGASHSAGSLPPRLRRSLSSGFTRCLALLVSYRPEGVDEDVHPVDALPGCVV